MNTCVPEWCEEGAPNHSDVCDNALMPSMTKREFVDYQLSAAEQGISGFRVLSSDEGFTDSQATAVAMDGVRESTVCFAQIGSCGRGWCHHG